MATCCIHQITYPTQQHEFFYCVGKDAMDELNLVVGPRRGYCILQQSIIRYTFSEHSTRLDVAHYFSRPATDSQI